MGKWNRIVQLVLHGVIGGVMAGIVLFLAQMGMSLVNGDSVNDPLRLTASLVMGQSVLDRAYPLSSVVTVGFALHFGFSAVFGTLFVLGLIYFGQLGSPTPLLWFFGLCYGFALWALNYVVIGSLVLSQVGRAEQFWVGFVAHSFFFGVVLGGYVGVIAPGEQRQRLVSPQSR